MKIALTSDTHYGFNHKTDKIHRKFWKKTAERIAEEQIRILILAGDIGSHKQEHLRQSLEMISEFIHIEIVAVRGNHDFWDANPAPKKLCDNDTEYRRRKFHELEYLHQRWFANYAIHHLENGPFHLEDVTIVGWDGWYGVHPPSNDANFMFEMAESVPMHTFMAHRAFKKLNFLLGMDFSNREKVIAVSHFPPYVTDPVWADMCANINFMGPIKEKFNYFCCGHNHQFRDDIEDGCRILNSGSDYNQPRLLVFEV